jgi:hypothetical protein
MKAVVLTLAVGVFLLAPLPARSAGHDGGHRGSAHGDFHHHGFDHRRFGGRFGYPSCFGYAYCQYYAPGCVWSDGYWIDQRYIGPDGIERFEPVWIPAGCY